jgi:hypothetical protein
MQAIRTHYGNSAVIVTEVANATGSGATRHIDALALGCWPSRGLFVHAIEIKVSLGDLKKELATPEKADAIAKYCDRMYLATPKGLVKDLDALPPAWGLYEADGGGLKTRKPAAELEALPLTRGFMMAVVRAAVAQHSDEATIAKRCEEAVRTARGEDEKQRQQFGKSVMDRAAETAQELANLKQSIGWAKAEDLAKARAFVEATRGNEYHGLSTAIIQIERLLESAKQCDALIAGLGKQKESA